MVGGSRVTRKQFRRSELVQEHAARLWGGRFSQRAAQVAGGLLGGTPHARCDRGGPQSLDDPLFADRFGVDEV